MRLALQRNAAGEPLFDDPETIKFFWDAKSRGGSPMLTPEDKEFLKTTHGVDNRGRTKKKNDTFVKIDSIDAAKAIWKYLNPEQKQALKDRWKELRNDSNL